MAAPRSRSSREPGQRSGRVFPACADGDASTGAQRQFQAMGRRDARQLAVALVAAYQGIALLANTLRDPGLVSAEGRRLERWIDDLAGDADRPGDS